MDKVNISIRMVMDMDRRIVVIAFSVLSCIPIRTCFASNKNCSINYVASGKGSQEKIIFVNDPFGIEESIKRGDKDKLIDISKYNNPLEKNLSRLALSLVDGDYENFEKGIKSGINYFLKSKNYNINILLYLYYNLSRVFLLEGDYKSWVILRNTSIENLKKEIFNCSGVEGIKISGIDDLHIEKNTKIPDFMSMESSVFQKNTSVSYLPSHGWAPIISVIISGRRSPAILDTGVFLTVIPKKMKENLHVHIVGSLDNFNTSGGYVINPEFGYIDNLVISGSLFKNIPVVLLDTDFISVGNQVLSKFPPFILSKNEISFSGIKYLNQPIKFNYAYSSSGLERNIVFPLEIKKSINLSVLDTGLESSHILSYEKTFTPSEMKKSVKSQIRSFSKKKGIVYYSGKLNISINGNDFPCVASDFVLKSDYNPKNIIGGLLSENSKLSIDFNKRYIYFNE